MTATALKPKSDRKTHAGGRPPLDKVKQDAIISLYNDDIKIKDIAIAVGTSQTTVYRVLRRVREAGGSNI